MPGVNSNLLRSMRERAAGNRWMAGAVVFFTSLVMLLVAEGALRVVGSVTDNVRGATFDSELGWRLVPGTTKRDQQWMDLAAVLVTLAPSQAWAGIPVKVPEPTSLSLLAAGLGGLALFRFVRRRFK